MNSDKAKSDLHVGGAHFGPDNAERLQRDGLSPVHARASGSAQPQLELACLNSGENLVAEMPANQNDDQRRYNQIHRQNQPAQAHDSP